MNIVYNDIEEKLEFYCHDCGANISPPPVQTNVRFCQLCGHKYDVTNVNKIRQKIKKLCFEEGQY